MTDRERLMISLLSHPESGTGPVTVVDVVEMLYALGAQYRHHRDDAGHIDLTLELVGVAAS